MSIKEIVEESKCQFMSIEALHEGMNKLLLAKRLAEEVEKDYEDAADWKDAKPKLTKLARELLS